MILENDFIRIELDATHGARIRALYDKSAGLELLSNGTDEAREGKPEAGLQALFAALCFEVNATLGDGVGSSATLSAISADGALKLTKAFAVRDRGFTLIETVENLSAREQEYLWGQRVEFSAPFIDAACEIVANPVSYFDPNEDPILRMRWPALADGTNLARARCSQPGETRTYYLADFDPGICRISSPTHALAVDVRWDAQTLPYCWIEERWGELSLAPFSGLPDAVEMGHGTLTLPAGGKAEAKIIVTLERN